MPDNLDIFPHCVTLYSISKTPGVNLDPLANNLPKCLSKIAVTDWSDPMTVFELLSSVHNKAFSEKWKSFEIWADKSGDLNQANMNLSWLKAVRRVIRILLKQAIERGVIQKSEWLRAKSQPGVPVIVDGWSRFPLAVKDNTWRMNNYKLSNLWINTDWKKIENNDVRLIVQTINDFIASLNQCIKAAQEEIKKDSVFLVEID